MGSLALSAESRRVLLADLQSIYDSHRYLDAYRLSAEYWNSSTAIGELSAEEMIFAGRLAARLGGFRLARHLNRAARERAPNLPIVRRFTRLEDQNCLLLDELCAFEKDPDLGGDDDHLRASWLASHAHTFAFLRDFSRAADLMDRAHALSPENAWLYSIEADMHGMADRWQDSRRSAERGCVADPRSPWPLLSLATALLNLGEIDEAVRRLSAGAEEIQFFQVVQAACWYHCALAETIEGDKRAQVLASARRLAERIEPMAPLADREFKSGLARTWLDIAELADDHEAMEHWSKAARSSFHRRVLANLKANPNGKRIRLPYRRALQKHVECVPTSIASALSATGVTLSVQELARDVTFGGTAEWAAADWLREKGFHVRFFGVTEDIVGRLIAAGIGFVVSWDDDESGHAVAIVGIDHAAGTAIAHDPNGFRTTEYLLAGFSEKYGPLGVPGMAVVPQRLADVLDKILPAESEVSDSARAHQKALTQLGPLAARPIIEKLEALFPDHPGTHYLRANQYLEEGRSGKALESFRKLQKAYPRSPSIRVRLMNASRNLGDTALLRETLRSVVDTGKLPGEQSQSDWAAPHPRYFYEYADLLRFSSETRARAESLLRSVLRTNWRSAGAWHVLADLRWGEGKIESALLAYRVASTTADHNEHYARAYANALFRSNRPDEAIGWLRTRAETLGKSLHGVSTWITYVDMLEDLGRPASALEVCWHALSRFGASPSLLSFAVPFLARMGEWEDAEKQLRNLEEGEGKGYFHEAAAYFNEMCGQTGKALEHAEEWVREFPLSMQARHKLLALIARVHGQRASFERATQWIHERPENEDFEELFCRHADEKRWRKLHVLKSRVRRNRDDAWAWRELAFTVIPMFEMADEAHRRRLEPQISSFLAEADRVAAEDATTNRAHGRWYEAQGNWKEACRRYLESLRRDPASSYDYRRVFAVSARFPEAERRAMWAAVEPIWLESPGHLLNCLELMRLLNGVFGPRETEEIIAAWQRRRPGDPNVVEAMADLLLEHGLGRSDALRALELLLPAVERYPYHAGLRFSLANAYRKTGDDAAARRVFKELVRRRPDDVSAAIQLAWIHEREGHMEEALRILQLAQQQEPQDSNPVNAMAQILIENRRYDEAGAVIQEGLRKLPDSVGMFERAISLLFGCGEDQLAVDAARQGVRAYPDGAYLWLLLGRTLRSHPEFAAPGEIEQCLRRSLQLNQGLFEPADWLAVLLTEQRRYEEAAQVIGAVEARLTDPSAAQGRKAWIRREAGQKREAVTELSEALKNSPSYSWGWGLLLAWLEEDKDWELSRKVLGPVPPQMVTDLSFRRKRLLLLEKTGTETASLDAEWQQLLEDFPEDVPLHLHRYDALRDANRWQEAIATLERIRPVADNDVYLMARLVDVKCHEGVFGEALEYALRVCFAPVEESNWPVSRVWEVLGTAEKDQRLADRFRSRLEEGTAPTRRALSRYLEYLLDQERSGGFLQLLRQTRLHHVTREIIGLMKAIERSAWRAEFHAGDLFAVLNTRRYSRLVVRFWREMGSLGLDQDSAAWAEAGRAMVNLGQKRSARELFRDWRNRHGVGMWVLANYMHSLSRFRRRDLEEVVVTCRDALADLPHDHCARYLTCMQAEACVLIGDRQGLLAVWRDRRGYFGGALKKTEYFKTAEKHLIYDIPDLVEALEREDEKSYRKMVRTLRFQRLRNLPKDLKGRRILRILLRVLVTLWMIAMMEGLFHR